MDAVDGGDETAVAMSENLAVLTLLVTNVSRLHLAKEAEAAVCGAGEEVQDPQLSRMRSLVVGQRDIIAR